MVPPKTNGRNPHILAIGENISPALCADFTWRRQISLRRRRNFTAPKQGRRRYVLAFARTWRVQSPGRNTREADGRAMLAPTRKRGIRPRPFGGNVTSHILAVARIFHSHGVRISPAKRISLAPCANFTAPKQGQRRSDFTAPKQGRRRSDFTAPKQGRRRYVLARARTWRFPCLRGGRGDGARRNTMPSPKGRQGILADGAAGGTHAKSASRRAGGAYPSIFFRTAAAIACAVPSMPRAEELMAR